MTIKAGTRLGPYEIVGPLGAGGMGEVYRAKDTRLERAVAIKVLPASLSGDADRLKRFEREARSASALNHPNIVTIHDIGLEGAVSFIAMELVEGRTLREVLGAGVLAPRKVLEIGAQVASGLAGAHAAGIVHRDLKPENVMIRSDGFVKILDFGLAKLTQPETSGGQTALETISAGTESGVVMGTVGYMSPEQASGERTDFRTDQFALGAMLYEMATGRRAFHEPTGPETLAAIIRDEPQPIASINPRVPAPLRWIAERCLAKEPSERYASTADLAKELRTLLERLSEITGTGEAAAVSKPRSRRTILTAAGLVAAAAVGGWLGRGVGSSRVAVPRFQQATFRRENIWNGAFAPDGKTIVYTAYDGTRHNVYILSPGSRESRALGVSGRLLSVSTSGELALLPTDSDTLEVAQIGGGVPRPLQENVVWADWAPDGRSLALIRNVGGKRQLEYPAGHVIHSTSDNLKRARVSPRGDRIVTKESGALVVFDRAGERTELAKDPAEFAWSPSGKEVLFTRVDRGAFDLYAVSLRGRERLLTSMPGDFTLFDVSADGRCVLERGAERWDSIGRFAGQDRDRDLRWLDATVPAVISADGKTLLFFEKGPSWRTATSYVRKTDGSPAVEIGPGFARALSPDGRWALVLPSSPTPSLAILPVGPGEARTLPSGDLEPWTMTPGMVNMGFLPDGKQVVFSGRAKGGKPRIYVQDVAGGTPRAISEEGVRVEAVSPNGVWVLGTSGGKLQLLAIAGGQARPVPALAEGEYVIGWNADSRALYIAREGDSPIRVSLLNVETGMRKLWKEIAHPASGDVSSLFFGPLMTPDGRSYVLTYARWLSDLFVLEGVR